MNQTAVLYPAIIYQSQKNKVYVANCIIKKLVGYGHSEYDAITNLEKILNNNNTEYTIKIKPVYNFLNETDLSVK